MISTKEKDTSIHHELEELKFLSAEQVRHIAKTFGTPCYVYDEATLLANAEYMQNLPHAFGLTVRYSLKALANKHILQLFNRAGLHFDTSSEWEVRRALLAGITGNKILLTSQECGNNLAELVQAGILFDACSLQQIQQYGQLFPNSEISIRINPGFGSGLVGKLTSGGVNSSFGIWHEDTAKAAQLIKKFNLKLVRLHSHIGSGHNPAILLDCLETLLGIAAKFTTVNTLNLGGGYRVKAFRKDVAVDHYAILEKAAHKLKKFAATNQRELQLELEPGSYLTVNAGAIITQVIDLTSTGKEGHNFIKINAGLSEIIRPSYYGAEHPAVIVPAMQPASAHVYPIDNYCIAGHCCIAGDILTASAAANDFLTPRLLPTPKIGDYLVIERAGGYCSSMSLKNFNSFPEAPEILRRSDGSLQLIRKRQTLAQICANEMTE